MNPRGPVLRGIHVPPAPWWPPAPGWWLVAALVVLVAVLVGWLLWRRVQRRPLRAALREIDVLESAFAREGDTAALAAGVSCLLRRVAVRVDPSLAATHGERWRAFLHRGANSAAATRALDVLMAAPFRERPAVDAPRLLVAARACCHRELRKRASCRARRAPGRAVRWMPFVLHRATGRGDLPQTAARGFGRARP